MTPSSATVRIRALGPEDAAMFHAVRARALRDHPDAFGRTADEIEPAEATVRRLRDDIGSDLDFTLGGFDHNALVATAGCHRERFVKHRHVAYIWGVYVSPEHRGTGLGRRIFEAVVDRARTWPDLEQLWLDVTTTNTAARALYASCGFRTLAVKPRSLKVGSHYYDEELMALTLRGPAAEPGETRDAGPAPPGAG